jgi:cysteine synthase B
VELVLPANVSVERKQIIQAYGAKVTYSDPMEGSDGAIRLCREILEQSPEKFYKPDQYFNPMNPEAHYENTGPEIYRQTNGTITHFVAGIGTGGTIMASVIEGTKPQYPSDRGRARRRCTVSKASSIASSSCRDHHEEKLDGKIAVSTEDAYSMVYRLSQEEGVLVGQSSGAALYAALKLARKIRSGTIVTIFPDFGDKYLSTNLWVGWRDRMAVGNLKFSI